MYEGPPRLLNQGKRHGFWDQTNTNHDPRVIGTLLTACLPAAVTPPPPLTVTTGMEFMLAPGQSAAVIDAVFSIRLIGITSDGRCPLDVECAESGMVSLSFTVQKGGGELTTFNLQTFTNAEGHTPDFEFEGTSDRAMYDGNVIRIAAVLPYPQHFGEAIQPTDYRVTFIVTGDK